MNNYKNRFYSDFTPHFHPEAVNLPPTLPECGLTRFDVVMIPEKSSKWPNQRINRPANEVRQWRPFIVLRYWSGMFSGLGCTSASTENNGITKIELPVDDITQINWIPEFVPIRTYAALPSWRLRYGELLFEAEKKPRKLGAIRGAVSRSQITTAVEKSESI